MSRKKDRAKVHRTLDVADLRSVCDPGKFTFKTTDELMPLEGIIGQQRAMRAIEFGLRMGSFGYNLFVAGNPGTGKKTLIGSLVRRIAREQPTPDDIFYVHNFEKAEQPRVIQVPPGVGNRFSEDMTLLVETLLAEVPKAFKSEDYEERKTQIVNEFQKKRAELIEKVQSAARERGLAVKSTGTQILTVPVIEGHEVSAEQFEELPLEAREEIQNSQMEFSDTIQEAYREIRLVQHQTHDNLKDLDRTVALIATGHYLDDLRNQYNDYPGIKGYLEKAQRDIIDNITNFLQPEEDEGPDSGPITPGDGEGNPLKRYRVNVIVDNSSQEGAPVVNQTHPTYRNLIGSLEREARMGTLYSDFTMIRAGSVLMANRGYLILDLVDLLTTPLAWESLKRVLQDGEVKIQDPGDQMGMVGTLGLRPEPVKVALKVIVLGSAELYNMLYGVDEDFQKLFKIKADFDTVMKKDDGHLEKYARFVKTLCEKEDLRAFDSGAVAILVEHGSRMVSDKERLTLRFSDVADLIRESDYWASQNGHRHVGPQDIRQAIEEKRYRSNLWEERLQEMIDEHSILIQTSGEAVGQINGLSVYQIGDYAFGKPTRLTAQVSVGDKGVVNIEREARMSGNIHDKGVLILSGYLHGKYGQKEPLSLYASICFEQSYAGVDGDSASSTELYAVLSSLTEVPLKQSIAVTGSINQKGVIQPIGGVNEKIEGFYKTCEADGLTGDQGVMIPQQNVQNLMLRMEVIEAVEQGMFHIYPVEHVDQGLEILTGMSAGKLGPKGNYPAGTIHFLAQKRLDEMAAVFNKRYRA